MTTTTRAQRRPRKSACQAAMACLSAAVLAAATPAAAKQTEMDERCQTIEAALQAWDVESAVALAEPLRSEQGLSPACACAMAAVALQQGDPALGWRRLQPHPVATLPSECGALRERVQAAYALAQSSNEWRTPHFLIRAQGKDEIVATYAHEVVARARSALLHHFPFGPATPWTTPVGVEIYPDVASLSKATGLVAKAIETSGTVAVCKEHRLLVLSPLATASGYHWADTLAHELTHFVVGRLSRNQAPVWLQEGIAKTYERSWRTEPGPALSRASLRRLRLAAIENALIPLSALHPSIALLPSQEATALAFSEVSSLIDGVRRRVGSAPLAAMLVGLGRGLPFAQAWRAPLQPLKLEEARWRAGLKSLPATAPAAGDDEVPSVVYAARAAGKPLGSSDELSASDRSHSARLLRLGDLLAVRNAWPAAAHAYQSSRRHNGASTALIDRRLARALMAQGKLAQARALASASLAANPDQPEGHWLAAQIALASNDCAAAVAHLHEVNLVNPFVAEVHESLAMCAQKRGDAQVQRQEIRFAALCAAPR